MDDAQRQVLAAIDEAETLELLRAMVSYPSFCGDEGPLAEYLAGWLDEHGFEARLADAEPGRPNVVGTLAGTGGGASVMFNGHLDIDPLPLSYERDPWTCTIEGGRMYGHGIRNMKGGDAAMLAAAAAIQRSGVRLRGDLVVACVVGELQGGIGTDALIRDGLVPHYAIVPEPTWLNVRTIHAGVLEFLVHVTGRSAGLDPKAPSVNAVQKMARVVEAIPTVALRHRPNPELPDLPRIRVGGIMGGLVRTTRSGGRPTCPTAARLLSTCACFRTRRSRRCARTSRHCSTACGRRTPSCAWRWRCRQRPMRRRGGR